VSDMWCTFIGGSNSRPLCSLLGLHSWPPVLPNARSRLLQAPNRLHRPSTGNWITKNRKVSLGSGYHSKARSILNEQLAELLRVVLEESARAEPLTFSFCPMCGNELSKYEQPEIWVQGRRCEKGHMWVERGGKLGSEYLRLHAGRHERAGS